MSERDWSQPWPVSEDQWKAAHDHIQEVRRQYTEIGASGVLGLTLTLNPLVVRYARGERTPELYTAMLATE
jgi:hypothetical protein